MDELLTVLQTIKSPFVRQRDESLPDQRNISSPVESSPDQRKALSPPHVLDTPIQVSAPSLPIAPIPTKSSANEKAQIQLLPASMPLKSISNNSVFNPVVLSKTTFGNGFDYNRSIVAHNDYPEGTIARAVFDNTSQYNHNLAKLPSDSPGPSYTTLMPEPAKQNTLTALSNQPNYQSPIAAAMSALTDLTNFGNLSEQETPESFHSSFYSSESVENAQVSASINSPPINQCPQILSPHITEPLKDHHSSLRNMKALLGRGKIEECLETNERTFQVLTNYTVQLVTPYSI